jgi:hypothetical protein
MKNSPTTFWQALNLWMLRSDICWTRWQWDNKEFNHRAEGGLLQGTCFYCEATRPPNRNPLKSSLFVCIAFDIPWDDQHLVPRKWNIGCVDQGFWCRLRASNKKWFIVFRSSSGNWYRSELWGEGFEWNIYFFTRHHNSTFWLAQRFIVILLVKGWSSAGASGDASWATKCRWNA